MTLEQRTNELERQVQVLKTLLEELRLEIRIMTKLIEMKVK